jgi:alpha-galactosidase
LFFQRKFDDMAHAHIRVARIVVETSLLISAVSGLDNGLGRLPQMGYNSWYDLECTSAMNETTLMRTADAMVTKGFVALGYRYLNLDDCYIALINKGRLPNGTLYPDPKAFPSGMKALADYVHSKGMLFGLYTDRGTKTCAGRAAAEGHEVEDAMTYARWGVDYLKEDSCNAKDTEATAFEQYGKMRDGLNATGRKIFFSLCGWHDWYAPPNPALNYTGGKSLGNSWRIGPDDGSWGNAMKNVDANAKLAPYAGAGGFNDPCLLVSANHAGKSAYTLDQSRAQFSLWAVMASPMLISGTVLGMSAGVEAIYTNREVIAISQDSLVKQGVRIVGEDLFLSEEEEEENKGPHLTAAALVLCNASDVTQQWTDTMPMNGYFKNAQGHCLNVNDCNTAAELIVYDSCPVHQCCDNCENMVFAIDAASGHLTSAMSAAKGLCAGSNSSSPLQAGTPLSLVDCNYSRFTTIVLFKGPSSQGLVEVTGSTAGQPPLLCLGVGAPSPPLPPPPSKPRTNVWARELKDGSYALFFINVGSATVDVACDATCFAAIGFQSTDVLTARDVIAHVDLPDITGATGYVAKALAPAGGSATLVVKVKA